MNYSQPSSEFSTKFFDLVDQAGKIVITAHEGPDEDSIASVVSVYDLISSKYSQKNTRIVYTGETENKYAIFKNFDKIEFVPDLADALNDTDLLIMLDGGQYRRFSHNPERLKAIKVTICIDHHSSPSDEFSLSLIIPTCSSCTEIIYLSLCADAPISQELAEILLLGILGDTGNFTYLKPHQTETLVTAKRLLDISKVEIQEFQSRYRSISKRVFQIVRELMKNTSYAAVTGWPDVQYSFIEKSFKENGQYSDREVSEANNIYKSHYLRLIEGHPWGFVITPRSSGEFDISLRSLPRSVNVRDLMERMGIGGGHDRAAGGDFSSVSQVTSVEDAIKYVLNWQKDNPPVMK